jgi:hypothetical protein
MKSLIATFLFVVDVLMVGHWLTYNGDEVVAFWPIALSVAFGLFNTASQYMAAQGQADIAEQQARLDAEAAKREAELDAKAETDEVMKMREEQRRRRASIEAGYAKSGVLMDGTPAEMLVKQREVDEYNVQKTHHQGNERRKLMDWKADADYQTGMAKADAYKTQANTALVSGLGSTAMDAYNMQSQAKFTSWKWFP